MLEAGPGPLGLCPVRGITEINQERLVRVLDLLAEAGLKMQARKFQLFQDEIGRPSQMSAGTGLGTCTR